MNPAQQKETIRQAIQLIKEFREGTRPVWQDMASKTIQRLLDLEKDLEPSDHPKVLPATANPILKVPAMRRWLMGISGYMHSVKRDEATISKRALLEILYRLGADAEVVAGDLVGASHD